MSPYVRTLKTASGATAVQFVHSSRRGSRDVEHIGSTHDEADFEMLRATAMQRTTRVGASSATAWASVAVRVRLVVARW